MTGFVDWATAQGVTLTTSNPTFGAVSYTVWARTDLDKMVEYARDGVTLITQTWHPTLQNYMATNGLLGRVSAGSGAIEEVSLSSVVPDAYSNILSSRLPSVSAFTCIEDTAYFVYVGCLPITRTPLHVEFYVSSAGSGLQTAEVGLFSTPAGPNKAGQTLTKLVASGTVDDLTGTGVKRNTSAFATSVAAGTHLWAGIRTAMATNEPAVGALGRDNSQGQILATTLAGALTGAGPWSGALVAVVAPTAGQHPELRVVFA